MEAITTPEARNLISIIALKSLELNQSTNGGVHVFFDYSGHVEVFNIRIYLGGWKGMADPHIAGRFESRSAMYPDAIQLTTLLEVIYVLTYLQTKLTLNPTLIDAAAELKPFVADALKCYRYRIEESLVDDSEPLPWDDSDITKAESYAIYDAGGQATDAYAAPPKNCITCADAAGCEYKVPLELLPGKELICYKPVERRNPCVDCPTINTCLLAEHDFNCHKEE